jgi:hypothetical protein
MWLVAHEDTPYGVACTKPGLQIQRYDFSCHEILETTPEVLEACIEAIEREKGGA